MIRRDLLASPCPSPRKGRRDSYRNRRGATPAHPLRLFLHSGSSISLWNSGRRGYGHATATTVPVPSCPGAAPYPGSVFTITIFWTSPLIAPDLVIELAAITAMNGVN